MTDRKANRISGKLIKDLCSLDNKMNDIFNICKKRHTITFRDSYHFKVVWRIHEFFKSEGNTTRWWAGSSITIRMNNCSVRIYREDRD